MKYFYLIAGGRGWCFYYTLYTERWLSLSSSSAEADNLDDVADDNNDDEEEEGALLQTPLTSSSCIAHCFSFLTTICENKIF